ncbi:MAG: hypothetical protein WHS46_09140 [Desulfosoma sp.]
MAEIKSTLDIVLEKTKHLVLTPQERQAMERKEHLERVPGMVQRFLDGAWSLEQMLEAWKNIPETYREDARKSMLQKLLDFLSEKKSLGALVPAFQALGSTTDLPYVDRLSQLAMKNKEADDSWEARQNRLLARLAEKGIRGDAVHVTPALDPQWNESLDTMAHQIETLKIQWLAALTENVSSAPSGPIGARPVGSEGRKNTDE